MARNGHFADFIHNYGQEEASDDDSLTEGQKNNILRSISYFYQWQILIHLILQINYRLRRYHYIQEVKIQILYNQFHLPFSY